MIARLFPVGIFVSLLRQSLELDPLYSDLWLEGEVSDSSTSSAGHSYFTLCDDDGSLKCVLFRNQALRQLRRPQLGDHVAVHGGLSIYPRTGSLQLVADLVRPAGLGAAWLELEYLRQRLDAEGLFNPLRKRQLPEWPRTIGVVTSPHGAAWHDIQTVIQRRYPLVALVLSPARVQGDGAPESIVAALEALFIEPGVEVIILARGGGGSDDLAAFNDERVVRAVFASPVPIIAGIGHATDRTLVEDTADAAAPTPSVAAEVCVPSITELDERLRALVSRLIWSMATRKMEHSSATIAVSRRLSANAPRARVRDGQIALAAEAERLSRTMRLQTEGRALHLSTTADVLNALDPSAVLRRGYAALRRVDDNRAIFSVTQIDHAMAIAAAMQDGSFSATVREKSPSRTVVNVNSRSW